MFYNRSIILPNICHVKTIYEKNLFYMIQCYNISCFNNFNINRSNYIVCKRKAHNFFYNTYRDPAHVKRNTFVLCKYKHILKSIKYKSEKKIECGKIFLSSNKASCSDIQQNELYKLGRRGIKDKKGMKRKNIDTNNNLSYCEKSIALLNTLYNIIQEKVNNYQCDDAYYIDEKNNININVDRKNKFYNYDNDKDLCNNIIDVIKNEKNIKTTFLILHTVNKIMCINKYIPYIYDNILLIEDMEILSIILRVLTNSFYDDTNLLFILMNKLKETIILGTSTNLTISNTFFSYSNFYSRGIIKKNDIPLEHILGILINYYDTFSSVQLVEILSNFEYYDFMKDKRHELVKGRDDHKESGKQNNCDNNNNNDNINDDDIKRLKKLRTKLFYKVANHFIQQDIIKELSTKEKIDLIYAFSKNKIYHEKIFLGVYEYLLKIIKGYNKDIINNKFSYVFDKTRKDENIKKSNSNSNNIANEYNIDDTNLKNVQNDIKVKSPFIDKQVLNDAIKNISNILYSYSKFNIYIDELYNQILLFLQYFYKYMDCCTLSQCLISLTKVNCNINILLSKIYKEKLDNMNVTNKDHFLAHSTSINLMNYLLSYSRNLFLEKGVYNIISYYLLKNDKIYSLNSLDLINIFHAYSKIYYIDKKLFEKIDHIILQRLEANKYYITIDLAIKYINAVAKLSYKNENIIYKIIEIIYQTNHLHNIKIIHLFKLLKNIKKLNIPYQILQKHIQMIAPNITLDFANYLNYYYKAKKDIHVRKKKWIW